MLERARNRLLGFLAQIFSADQRGDVTVVFDSAVRLPDTPDYLLHNGIHVHFASGHRDADEMIIDMLLRHSAPKSLLIVSSDHQIQQAAQRRRARFVDSDKWYDETLAANRTNPQVVATAAQIQLEVQLELKETSAAGADPDQTRLLEEFSQNLEHWVSPTRSNPASAAPEPVASPDPNAPARKSPREPATRPATTGQATGGGTPAGGVGPGTGSGAGRSGKLHGHAAELREDEAEFEDAVAGLDLRPKLDTPLKHGLLTDLDEDQWLAALDREFESFGLSGSQPPRSTGSSTESTPRTGIPPVDPRTEPPSNRANLAQPTSARSEHSARPDHPAEPLPPDAEQIDSDEPQSTDEEDPGNAAPEVTDQQFKRWNRQLAETDLAIFPPGYGEDVLFSESFQIDDRLKKKRRPGRS